MSKATTPDDSSTVERERNSDVDATTLTSDRHMVYAVDDEDFLILYVDRQMGSGYQESVSVFFDTVNVRTYTTGRSYSFKRGGETVATMDASEISDELFAEIQALM